MSLDELVILDVGHGNAAVCRSDDKVVVIDCGADSTLAQYVEQNHLTVIEAILISHADEDHLRGILFLLEGNPDLRVNAIYVNPAQQKKTELWLSFSFEMQRLEEAGAAVITALTRSSPGSLSIGNLVLEVLSPPPAKVLTENRDNRWSATVRVNFDGDPVALLCSDIDRTALTELLGSGREMQARVLVFPHHGGRPGGADPGRFATDLTSAVKPSHVVFSMGKGRYDNPLPAIVDAVRAVDNPRIICTQLSNVCSGQSYRDRPLFAPSAGLLRGNCCAGTIRIPLPMSDDRILPDHASFVDVLEVSGQSPRCRLKQL